MTDIAATKARLLAKLAERENKDRQQKNQLDLTPILDYLQSRLDDVNGTIPAGISSVRDMKRYISEYEEKEALERLIERVNIHQNPKHPEGPMNIHILTIYLFPDLFEYGLEYDPTNDCRVGRMYDAIGKVLCNWSGHDYYGG